MKNNNDASKGNFTIVPNFIVRDPEITPYAKAIFMLIRSYSPSYPSYSRIQKETGIGSRTTISKSLQELAKKGLITITNSPNHKSSLYGFPNPSSMDSSSPKNGHHPVQEMDTNKTNLKIPNNNATEASTDPPVESSLRSRIFAEAESSLGPDASEGYIPKERPTFLIEALKK